MKHAGCWRCCALRPQRGKANLCAPSALLCRLLAVLCCQARLSVIVETLIRVVQPGLHLVLLFAIIVPITAVWANIVAGPTLKEVRNSGTHLLRQPTPACWQKAVPLCIQSAAWQ